MCRSWQHSSSNLCKGTLCVDLGSHSRLSRTTGYNSLEKCSSNSIWSTGSRMSTPFLGILNPMGRPRSRTKLCSGT